MLLRIQLNVYMLLSQLLEEGHSSGTLFDHVEYSDTCLCLAASQYTVQYRGDWAKSGAGLIYKLFNDKLRFQAWCPGSIPGWDLSTDVVSLGKKLYPHCLMLFPQGHATSEAVLQLSPDHNTQYIEQLGMAVKKERKKTTK